MKKNYASNWLFTKVIVVLW